MLKKIIAAKRISALAAAAVLAVSMAGCSKNYTMTEKDLSVQNSLVGYWAADDSTGYNEYDGNGYITMMVAVQFTDDYNYILYNCYLNENYVMSYSPISYTIEEGKFRVDVNGVPSYAGIGISEDGTVLSWITDERTEKYIKFSDERAAELGIPPYNPDANAETENGDDNGETGSPEDTAADTQAEESGEDSEE